ncbi:MAG: hypothetical protein HYX77_01800 [Acidobacteria bacterium]|nr:hypothetical protein [Acidobacteriota bacterium]
MTSRVGARLLTSVVVFCVCAELVALSAYYVETGGLFYTHRKTYQELPPAPENRRLVTEALHPYFGPTHTPGTAFDIPEALRANSSSPSRLNTNNFGFVSSYSYPFVKTRDSQFVIGMFGGSVGVWFCQVGAHRLLEELKRHPFFQNKEVIPLCFSHEGYKQPQEALVLAYFLAIGQQFDLIVNIDGFNDVALANLNNERGVDISMPSVQHLDPLINLVNQSTLTPDKLESLATVSRDKRQLADLGERILANRLASVNAVLDWSYTRGIASYIRELGRFNNLPSAPSDSSLFQVTPTVRALDAATVFTGIADNWTRSSLLMGDMLAARGGAYFHFLQPNQYYTTRRFNNAEAAVALSEASPYKRSVEQGYPALTTAAQSRLLNANVRFFDATHVFDRESASVYIDNCCHYTLIGNQVLADFIAASILNAPGPWKDRVN